MLIVCPSCASSYALDPARIGPAGRRVRCAACRESWLVTADAALEAAHAPPGAVLDPTGSMAAVETVLPPQPEPDRPGPEMAAGERGAVVIDSDGATPPRRPARSSLDTRRRTVKRRPSRDGASRAILVRLAKVGLALAVLAVPAALLARAGIVRAVPQSAVLFAGLGLPVNLVGLDFAEVTSALGEAGGKAELRVEGRIVNATNRALAVPPLDLAVRGEDGSLLYNWTVAAPEATVAAGATTGFRARLASPPPAARTVAVTFKALPGTAVVALR